MTYSRKDVLEATGQFTGLTIPVHIKLGSEQVILSQPEMQERLHRAEMIAVGNCLCREEEQNCSSLLESCLALNEEASRKISEHGWRAIDRTEAMALLDETYRQGLVHMAYRRAGAEDDPVDATAVGFVCSCCSCCCKPLNGLRQFKYSDAITRSAYVATLDLGKCIGCGTCVGRCLFGAYTLPEGTSKASLDVDRCFGCGLCVETCPVRAIAFSSRESIATAGEA